MMYRINKLRAFAAMMIAVMVISIAVPSRVANSAPVNVPNSVIIYQHMFNALVTWNDLLSEEADKVRIFYWNNNDPAPDLNTSTQYTEVDNYPKQYTVQLNTPGEYTFAVVGIDNSGTPTTLPLVLPVDARIPTPSIENPVNTGTSSRSIVVNGEALSCTGCELYIRVSSNNSLNPYSRDFSVPAIHWTAGTFSTTITLDDALDDVYHVFAVLKSPSLNMETVGTYYSGGISLDTTPPAQVSDLQTSVDADNHLKATWSNPASINGIAATLISIKRPGSASHDAPITKNINTDVEHIYESLPPGQYEIKVVTRDYVGNLSQEVIASQMVFPLPVTGLNLQERGTTNDTIGALHWLAPNAEYDHFRIYFKRDGENYDPTSYTVMPRPSFWGAQNFEFGVSPGKYHAKVVTVDTNGNESIPQEIALDFEGKVFPDVQLSGRTVKRNTNQYTVSGTTHFVYHYFTELRIYSIKNSLVEGFEVATWNKINNQFSATITFPDEDTYMLRGFLTNPVDGYEQLSFLSQITVEYDANLPNLPENIETTVQDNDIVVEWDLPVAPNYEQVLMSLMNRNSNSIIRTDAVNNGINQYRFEDLSPGTYYVVLDVANADSEPAQAPYTSDDLTVEVPSPVLVGPAEVKTDSPAFTVNGTAPFCTSCTVFVTVRDMDRNDVEPAIEATNWSATDNKYSVTSATIRPFDVYIVDAHMENLDYNSYSMSPPSNPITFVYTPKPVLNGPAVLNTSSGILTLSGSAETCTGCEVIVSVYDLRGNVLEDIKATNWSTVDNTFSIKTTVNLPDGTYKANAALELKGYTGPVSNDISIRVAKNATEPNTPPSGGGGSVTPIKGPVIVPAPSADETTFYLTPEASERDGFKRSIRLSVDKLAVDQDVPIKVRKLKGSSLSLPTGYSAQSDAFTLISDKPISIPPRLTLWYTSETMKDANPQKLGIYRQSDSDNNVWTYVGGVVNKEDNSISARIAHPGTYAALLYDKSFQDLVGHWSKDEVEALASRQLINGTTAKSFEPNRAINRAEALKMLIETTQYNDSFSLKPIETPIRINDVSSSSWYYDDVMKAATLGIIDEGAFRPDDPITREEFADMIFRLSGGGATNDSKLQNFKDEISISNWARKALSFATENGILMGSSNGHLNPQGHTTRSEAAAIVLRTMIVWKMVESDDPATAGSLDVTIFDTAGNAIGWAILTPQQDGVRLQLKATGLKPGKHGFHIHEKAFTWLDFKSAGGHFNPDAKKHGHNNPQGQHQGDMPNLVADKSGVASVDMVLKGVALSASEAGSILNRSIIIHAAEDDYKSDPAGNAGDRISGGIIAQ